MWNPHTVDVVEGSYRAIGAPGYRHGCTTARFGVGAKGPVLIAGYHGDLFRLGYRYNEALRLKGTTCTTGGVRPALGVGDVNSIWIRAPSRHRWEVDLSETIDKRSFSVIAGKDDCQLAVCWDATLKKVSGLGLSSCGRFPDRAARGEPSPPSRGISPTWGSRSW
ncbi:hypothetical protein [Streptomyces sp. NPDC051214]|uniref:hypothetical protein n=1 Tax=Streptomyces sp. NPDC051214 TaxID=3155282 RepID=UPI00342FC9C1